MKLLDCTLRDGGYYNAWDFSVELINDYLLAMQAAGVDIVELGFRSLNNKGFKGACAYTTDDFLRSLDIPSSLTVGVMVNGSEFMSSTPSTKVLDQLFPVPASESPVDLVRIACHVHEFEEALNTVSWLQDKGYKVGFNLMQVANHPEEKVKQLAQLASSHPIDALYFADSMGSMTPDRTSEIISWFRSEWKGPMGIHTHDNLGLALSNSLRAIEEGVTWIDSTVTGMGRGPGNALTEQLAIEIASIRNQSISLVPLMALIRKTFGPMKTAYGWGTNPYYYLAGKYAIHPSYIQEMMSDSRYDEEDILAVIEHLRVEGGKKFSLDTLDVARHFYHGEPTGSWAPINSLKDRDILILGTGPGVSKHRSAIERYIEQEKPIVLALNTQSAIDSKLIHYRVACHPVRLLADCEEHTKLPQPLITPFSMLPNDVKVALKGKEILDFGMNVKPNTFEFLDKTCTVPTSLVMAYSFAVATSGEASKILLAGFDGYNGEDPRNSEMNSVVKKYKASAASLPIISILPTRYDTERKSIYGMIS